MGVPGAAGGSVANKNLPILVMPVVLAIYGK